MDDYAQAPWTPRDWQLQALDAVRRADDRPVVRAVTGAGKSGVIAEICFQAAAGDGDKVVVTTPTKKLVEDLSSTIRQWGALRAGRFYTDEKTTHTDVVVCCNDSLPTLADRIDAPDLWICDEAHKSECDTLLDTIRGPRQPDGTRDESEAWTPKRRAGFTATPYRADDSEQLSLWGELAYDYGPADAIGDGVVVPPKVKHYHGTADTLDAACVELIRDDALERGPGVVDAANIEDAEQFADRLRDAGIAARAVHSQQHDRTVRQRIEQLEDGTLDCLVHVSLLSEGVDLPWLRWLCCRRPISSRVLFAQYVGRGLRTHPGKDYCVVYDPQDLFGDLSLDYEAILDGGLEDDSDETIPELPALELDWTIEQLQNSLDAQETLEDVPLQVVDPTVSYIRRLRLAFQSMGRVSMEIEDADWRDLPPTDRQLDRIDEWSWLATEPDVPATHQRALRIACRSVRGTDRGTASDLISILEALRYGWPEGAEQEVDAEGVSGEEAA